MIETRIDKIAGAIVFWSFKEPVELRRLEDALRLHGFSKHSPERMTDGAALRAALSEEYPGHKVFPVKGGKDETKEVFEAIKIEGETTRNEYVHVCTASVDNGRIETDTGDYALYERLVASFAQLTSLVPVGQLTGTMVSIIGSLGGVSMRPSGGVYWMPEENWDRWYRLVADIELCGKGNRFDACRVILDQNCLDAVREALTNEIEREAKSIDETIHDPVSGKRAASNAMKKAASLRDKIVAYEASFGMGLDALKGRLDEATTLEATATLLDVANQMNLLQFAN